MPKEGSMRCVITGGQCPENCKLRIMGQDMTDQYYTGRVGPKDPSAYTDRDRMYRKQLAKTNQELCAQQNNP